ncbi:MAG: YigZ family protein [Fibrobacterota bacterium]
MALRSYAVPKSPIVGTVETKGSRFLCEIRPIQSEEELKSFIHEKRNEHPKANHTCWAAIYGPPDTTVKKGFSDDGEPSGCAGMPMLTVLSHSGIGHIAAVVTRYFGGTKLGTGGMVKAYTGAVQKALSALKTEQYEKQLELILTFDYDLEPQIRHMLTQFCPAKENYTYTHRVHLSLSIPRSREEELRALIADRWNIRVRIEEKNC